MYVYAYMSTCTVYNVHYTLYSVHCTSHCVHLTIYTVVRRTLYVVHRTVYVVSCTPYLNPTYHSDLSYLFLFIHHNKTMDDNVINGV